MSTTTGPDLHERAVALMKLEWEREAPESQPNNAEEYRYTLAILRAVGPVREALRTALLLAENAAPGAWSSGVTAPWGGPDEGDLGASRMVAEIRTALALLDAATGGEG